MHQSDLHELADLTDLNLLGRWVAIDTRGGNGLRALPSGAVLVDYDTELDDLCLRVEENGRKNLTIFLCNPRTAVRNASRTSRGRA